MFSKVCLLVNTAIHYKKSQIFFLFYHKFKKLRLKKSISNCPSHTIKLNNTISVNDLIYHPCKLNNNGEQLLLNHVVPLKNWQTSHDELINFHIQYMDVIHSLPQRSAEELITHWISHNPPLSGSGWHPYPVSRRLINWVIFFQRHHIKQLSKNISKSIAQQLMVLNAIPEKHLLGNHLIANASALIICGVLLDQPLNIQSGCKILRGQLAEQFYEDGCHYERSIMYHISVLQDLWNCFNCLTRYTTTSTKTTSIITKTVAQLEERLKKGGEFLERITHNNSFPHFGDSAEKMTLQPEQLIKLLHTQFNRKKMIPSEKLTHFKSGYLMYKSDSKYIVFNCGPLGPNYLVGHGHSDLLSFEYWEKGCKIISDSGTYSYQGVHRPYFRSINAHSTLSIENKDIHQLWSNFKVGNRTHPISAQCDTDEMSMSGSHKGFKKQKTLITRKIWCAPSESNLKITDTINSPPNTFYKSYFHIHHIFSEYTIKENTVIFSSPDGKIVTIETDPQCQIKIENGMESTELYKKTPRFVLCCFGHTGSKTTHLNTIINTTLNLS
jgi:uncharacterized heparinase superfamily protein